MNKKIYVIINLTKVIKMDFNNKEELELTKNNKRQINRHIYYIVVLSIFFILSILVLFKKTDNNERFEFKTITTNCEKFTISASVDYDKQISSLYITSINYCGGNDKTKYDNITCSLYESVEGINKKISTCSSRNNMKLETYLEQVHLNIDSYLTKCKSYNNSSLYLEINAVSKDKNNLYIIPLNLGNSCSK